MIINIVPHIGIGKNHIIWRYTLKIFVSIIITALVSISAYACGSCTTHASHANTKTVATPIGGHDHAAHNILLDNIVKTNSDGNHTALCGCGMEVSVNDLTLSSKIEKTTLYTCGKGCADQVSAASDKEKMELMAMWKTIAAPYVLASNSVTTDGKQVATCDCGMKVTVGEHTRSTIENGVQLYFCGEGCQNMVMNMSDKDRSAMQAKFTESN